MRKTGSAAFRPGLSALTGDVKNVSARMMEAQAPATKYAHCGHNTKVSERLAWRDQGLIIAPDFFVSVVTTPQSRRAASLRRLC
jgi:hypothetical protein